MEPTSAITSFAITGVPNISPQIYVFKFIFEPATPSSPFYIEATLVSVQVGIKPVFITMPLPIANAPASYSTIIQTITLYLVNNTTNLTSSLIFYN